MKVTLHDIARDLDISSATVSRSLRNDALIHPDTRARVHETALRLGYKGVSGRGGAPGEKQLQTEKNTLGLLLHVQSLAKSSQVDQNLVQMMEGVMSEANKLGFLVNVHAVEPAPDGHEAMCEERMPSLIHDNVCQAVIIRGPHEASDVACIARRLPVVSLGRVYRELDVDAVLSDDIEGVRAIVERLVALGHRRLGWIGGHTATNFFEARQSGFVMGCMSAGLALHKQRFFGPEIFKNRFLHEMHGITDAVRNGATALVCANDAIARQVTKALAECDLRVPNDVSVTGFDAGAETTIANLQLTGVDPHFVEMGRSAVRLVALRLAHPTAQPQMMVVRGEVVDGETVGPARNQPTSFKNLKPGSQPTKSA